MVAASGDLARRLHSPRHLQASGMIEILRTNDPVTISFVEALFRDAGIHHLVADSNMSIMEGSIGILPRRVLVPDDEANQARRILRDAGIGDEISTR